MESIKEGFYNLNGKLFPNDRSTIDLNNRAFNYGDGLFETIRVKQGIPLFVKDHLDRLKKGMEMLSLGPLDFFSAKMLEGDLEELIQANGIFEGGRIKLIVYRKSGGFYTPQTNKFDYVITANAIALNDFKLNIKGLKVGVYKDLQKPISPLGNIKTLNALIYILAGVHQKASRFNEVLIENTDSNIIESTSSNLFIVNGKEMITSPLASGCLDGVMRKKIIQLSKRLKYKLIERVIDEKELVEADEAFLSNAIQGIQWIGAFKTKRFFNHHSKKVLAELNKLKS